MKSFLDKLYSYEYFGIYLMICIIVLIALFIVVLFFGKKDKRNREIEATKKLQQLNNTNTNTNTLDPNAFKDESVVQNLEVSNNTNMQSLENDTIIMPSIDNNIETLNEMPEITPVNNEINVEQPIITEQVINEPEIVNINDDMMNNGINQVNLVNEPIINSAINNENNIFSNKEETINNLDLDNVDNNITDNNINNINYSPLLDKIEEKPLVFNTTTNNLFDNDYVMEPSEEKNQNVDSVTIQNVTNIQPNVEVPEFNFDEIVKSVEEVKNDTPIVETPVVNKRVFEPTFNKGPEVFSSVYVPEKEKVDMPKIEKVKIEEDDFELPQLKKETKEDNEEKIEMPELNDYNLNDLTGESYTLDE